MIARLPGTSSAAADALERPCRDQRRRSTARAPHSSDAAANPTQPDEEHAPPAEQVAERAAEHEQRAEREQVPVITHCRAASPASRSPAIAGSAALTTVPSRNATPEPSTAAAIGPRPGPLSSRSSACPSHQGSGQGFSPALLDRTERCGEHVARVATSARRPPTCSPCRRAPGCSPWRCRRRRRRRAPWRRRRSIDVADLGSSRSRPPRTRRRGPPRRGSACRHRGASRPGTADRAGRTAGAPSRRPWRGRSACGRRRVGGAEVSMAPCACGHHLGSRPRRRPLCHCSVLTRCAYFVTSASSGRGDGLGTERRPDRSSHTPSSSSTNRSSSYVEVLDEQRRTRRARSTPCPTTRSTGCRGLWIVPRGERGRDQGPGTLAVKPSRSNTEHTVSADPEAVG